MTTSPTLFPSGMIEDGEIDSGKLAYFRERLKNRLHEVVVLEFIRQQDTYGLTKAELGRRIGKPPERITRLLSAPGNWELETVSDLLLGMASELEFAPVLLTEKIKGGESRAPTAVAQNVSGAHLHDLAAPRGIGTTQTASQSSVSTMTGSAPNVSQRAQ
jgi:hypothetical protein